MEEVSSQKIQWTIPLVMLIVLFTLGPVRAQAQDGRPVADAGSPRYAATDPVLLDGTGSYDPDNSSTLSYTWQQISGPGVIITDANTTTPTISGFVQTDEIQECEFELIVSDGELTSLPANVKVTIVRDFGNNIILPQIPPFDPDKPTMVAFGGAGGCQNIKDGGYLTNSDSWREIANFVRFDNFHASIYEKLGDMLIVSLSKQAPDYKQPIQTVGHSAGGEPAIDIAIYLNETYADARYAVNRVTILDATDYCRDFEESIERFIASSVDGEQCWIDNYSSTLPGSYGMKTDFGFHANVLNIWFDAATGPGTVQDKHWLSHNFYRNSLPDPNLSQFNHGIVAGAYWSVVGPGKKLQLASNTDFETYKYTWYGNELSGYMDLFDEPNHPGRLPEPVTLSVPVYPTDSLGVILTCEESENAVGYELLFGSDPYRIMDYNILSDSPAPPNDVITSLPLEEGWWTVRARDQYGSTIYADPIFISAFSSNPNPADGALQQATWANLSWTPGIGTASYDVYLGEHFVDVQEGTAETFQGNQITKFFVVGFPGFLYPDGLVPGTTYFWRIDDVGADGTILHKGKVWRFTVSP